jgi:hypothetical protein
MAPDNSELSRAFASPDETRNFPKGKMEVVKIGGLTFGRATLEPGWRWSECVKPIAGTESCQVHHTGIMISGRLGIRMDDGRETVLGPGDALSIPPGHDGWVVGDEPVVNVDVMGAETFAKPQ